MFFERPKVAQQETSNFLLPNPERMEVTNNYKIIKGRVSLVNREPDGDSVGFIADNIDNFKDVYRSYALKPSKTDNSVQLRFEGIDTSELHYGGYLQPCSVEARDYLLKDLLGFAKVSYQEKADGGIATKVVETSPLDTEIFIATNMLEIHGRPVSYLFKKEDSEGLEDGATVPIDSARLCKSINYKMLEAGWAYLLAYTSMPLAHFSLFKTVANGARSKNLGVWKNDSTADFKLSDFSSIHGLDAQLIYPKLFRRCIDYLKSGQKDLKEWLRANGNENDEVRVAQGTTVNFSSLIKQVNDTIYFQADTTDIIFIEK